ncbi:MAG: addiction module protein [Blastocatellia bacterium]
MAENFEEIISAALSLPPGTRAMPAQQLLESLDSDNQQSIDSLWAEEAEKRLREIDSGNVGLINGKDVLEKLRSRP